MNWEVLWKIIDCGIEYLFILIRWFDILDEINRFFRIFLILGLIIHIVFNW